MTLVKPSKERSSKGLANFADADSMSEIKLRHPSELELDDLIGGGLVSVFETIKPTRDSYESSGGTACEVAMFGEKVPAPSDA